MKSKFYLIYGRQVLFSHLTYVQHTSPFLLLISALWLDRMKLFVSMTSGHIRCMDIVQGRWHCVDVDVTVSKTTYICHVSVAMSVTLLVCSPQICWSFIHFCECYQYYVSTILPVNINVITCPEIKSNV